jgi:hypothetical protein
VLHHGRQEDPSRTYEMIMNKQTFGETKSQVDKTSEGRYTKDKKLTSLWEDKRIQKVLS